MRSDEESADRGALRLLVRSRIDPSALANAFEQLEKHAPELPGALNYLSTHPPLGRRRAAAADAAREARAMAPWTTALDGAGWGRLRTGCGCGRL